MQSLHRAIYPRAHEDPCRGQIYRGGRFKKGFTRKWAGMSRFRFSKHVLKRVVTRNRRRSLLANIRWRPGGAAW